MITNKLIRHFENDGGAGSFVSFGHALDILSRDNEYTDDVLTCFSVDRDKEKVIAVGNVRELLDDISDLDSQAEKIDVRVKLKDIVLEKMLEDEVALFTLYGIADVSLLSKLHQDCLLVESRYNAKNEVLDFYHLSKFANFCHKNGWDSLLPYIRDYIRGRASDKEYCSARLIRPVDSDKYLLRAVTSDTAYKNYGINFSVLVALLALNKIVKDSKMVVYVESYQVDDSRIYVSFRLGEPVRLSNNLELSFCLVLENDEIKDSSVTFTGTFQLIYSNGEQTTSIYLRPKSSRDKGDMAYDTEMLAYTHSMKVENVVMKMHYLPDYIKNYVDKVSSYAKKIIDINNPKEMRDYIVDAVRHAKNVEFAEYKEIIVRQLLQIEADSIFNLFNALRRVEDLFDNDIASREYWRTKLFSLLLERGRDK